MKKFNVMKMAAVAMMLFAFNQNMDAQFLKKVGKLVNKTTDAVDKTAKALDASETKVDTLNWEKIPVYTATKVNVVDADGKPVMLEDGTPDYRVFLVDQFGNKRSAETVKAQQKVINNRLLAILAKVGGGAALGGLSKGLSGAAVGAATGALASADDIAMATKQKKSLNQQKKLLETYQKNFTIEGKPVNAKVDVAKLKDLNLDDSNASSVAADDIKKELESEAYKTTDESSWDF